VASYRIRFLPDNREAEIDEGATLLDAARSASVYVGSICNGEGVCGKCRVIVREGEVAGDSTEFLTREEIRHGYVLACQVVPKGDVVVEVPPESRLATYKGIGEESEQFSDFEDRVSGPPRAKLRPLVEKHYLVVGEPTLDDPTGDHERLLDLVRRQGPPGSGKGIQMGLKVARELPRVLRRLDDSRSGWKWEWDGRITATVGSRNEVDEVLFVERGDTSDRNYGLAVDIGTTTVVAHLVDLITGVTREAAAKYNSQIEFGADVISRINHARDQGGVEQLQRSVISDVETLIEDLVRRARIGRGDIFSVVVSGNTTMLHFLLGLEPDLIRLSPFVPAATSPPVLRAAEVGIRIHPRGLLYTMPIVGSYVGGDITAGVLVSGMFQRDDLSILLDIGTNGEVVLGNTEFMVACSASAGPAFEGGSVKCGMRATAGAIDSVRIFKDGLRVSATTIGDAPPVGLCGTGLVDALAEMLLAGVVDRSGNFQVARAPGRFREAAEDGRPEFVLVAASESGGPRDVTIDQSDVENLIRTKAAIYAAADTLVSSLGLTFDDIQKIYIAGAFGNRLDVQNCMTIGLLPEVPPERVQFIGNTSVAGAKHAVRSRKLFALAGRIRDSITYKELMVEASYMERFTSACFLPHTDVSRFRSVEAKLQQETND